MPDHTVNEISSGSAQDDRHRVFFALWPDDETRQKIIHSFNLSPQSKFHARKMRPENIHITLHFIGNVTDEKLQCLHQAAQAVSFKPFELVLDRYGHFYKARVLWMGCHNTPETLLQLYNDLGDALSVCDYQIEKRPFAAHLTLMRKLNKPGVFEDFEAIRWAVNEFVLVESVPAEYGVEYRVIKKYKMLS